VIAFLHAGDAAADIDHDAGTFTAENHGKQAFLGGDGRSGHVIAREWTRAN
jgi:hypothetical protein